MRKLLLGSMLLFSIMSCTIQEVPICGTVTRHDTRKYNNGHTTYYLFIDNYKKEVTEQSWWDTQIGDYVCLD